MPTTRQQYLLRVIAYFGVAAAVSSGCVPAQYQSAPVPSGTNQKRQSADETGGNNPTTLPSPSQTSTATATGTAVGATPGPVASQTPSVNQGTIIKPGVPERDALEKCMNLWGTTPFKVVKEKDVKVMDVSVGIGGSIFGDVMGGLGNLANFNVGNTKDLEVTSEPKLIIIPLSVNLGGTTTYELMNPNGWYCLKLAVGAKSSVNIKHHCNAKIAQSDLGVSINTSSMGTSAGTGKSPISVSVNDGRTPGSQMGIMVDSNVKLTAVSCP